MFPLVYRRDTQTSEIHLYTSMDGVLWDRVPGGPVLQPSDPSGLGREVRRGRQEPGAAWARTE